MSGGFYYALLSRLKVFLLSSLTIYKDRYWSGKSADDGCNAKSLIPSQDRVNASRYCEHADSESENHTQTLILAVGYDDS